MRKFIILLLLANLAYLAWNLVNPPESRPVLVRAPISQADQTLILLGELTEDESPANSVAGTCISLGVFNNTEESDFLVSALLERGLDSTVELLPSRESRNFRVFMPPFISSTAARETLDALQANNFDSFIITTGELADGISLGLFTREDLALVLQEDLASEGFPTSIQEIVTTENEIWVTIEGLSQALLEGSELLDLLSQGLDLEVLEKPCETFASRP